MELPVVAFARARLIQLFPNHPRVSQPKIPPPPPAKPKIDVYRSAEIIVIPVQRCSQRACPFPVFRHGLCRGHAADALAERSLVPSVSEAAISNVLYH